MSDEKLRELERRFKETGSVEDEAAWLKERVRAGDLSQERLELAAYCALSLADTTDVANGVVALLERFPWATGELVYVASVAVVERWEESLQSLPGAKHRQSVRLAVARVEDVMSGRTDGAAAAFFEVGDAMGFAESHWGEDSLEASAAAAAMLALDVVAHLEDGPDSEVGKCQTVAELSAHVTGGDWPSLLRRLRTRCLS